MQWIDDSNSDDLLDMPDDDTDISDFVGGKAPQPIVTAATLIFNPCSITSVMIYPQHSPYPRIQRRLG